MIPPGQRLPQRQEQRAALAPGLVLQPAGQGVPRIARPIDVAGDPGRKREVIAILFGDRGRDRSLDHMPPVARLGDARQIGADRQPGRLIHARRQAIGHRGDIELVHDPRVDRGQLGLVESRRRSPEPGKIEPRDQRRGVDDRFDRIARPQPREERPHRFGLDAALAEAVDADRAEPFRQLAFAADQQRLMGEGRRRHAHRLEHLQLQRGVGDVILAADDMGDAHLGIVDGGRQHVQPRSVSAADNRIAHRSRVEMLGPADQVGPFDHHAMVELEPPMRFDALCLECRALIVGQPQRRAVIDGRQPAPQQDLALQLQFLCSLICRIDAASCDQGIEPLLIQRETGRLAFLGIRNHAQPREVGADGLDKPFLAAFGIGIVDP